MYKIYLIEDINGLKYVGKTRRTLKQRMSEHKKINNTSSSRKLDLQNCKISLLETCDKDNSFERERYWINYYETVNEFKLRAFTKKETGEIYYNEVLKNLYAYRYTWGGDKRSNNNLLSIDINLFE